LAHEILNELDNALNLFLPIDNYRQRVKLVSSDLPPRLLSKTKEGINRM